MNSYHYFLVPIDPESRTQGHREIHHLLRLGDNDRLPFEAAKPVPLTTMVPFNPGGFRLAHDQFFRRKLRRIHLPVIRAIEGHVP